MPDSILSISWLLTGVSLFFALVVVLIVGVLVLAVQEVLIQMDEQEDKNNER